MAWEVSMQFSNLVYFSETYTTDLAKVIAIVLKDNDMEKNH